MTSKVFKLYQKLIQKRTVILLNEETHEEQFSVRLNPFNVLLIIALASLLIISFTVIVILYTPLHGYIASSNKQIEVKEKRELLRLTEQLVELEERLHSNDIYINNVRAILAGEIPMPEVETVNGKIITSVELDKLDLSPTKDDLSLRHEVEKEEVYSVRSTVSNLEAGSLLFTPLKGIITGAYEPSENHLAIDIAAQEGEAIKSVAAGTVIFADWTPDAGYVAVVQHANGMISVYKHNLTIYKKVGDVVKKGEVISAVGNTGELTTGPHLHFELWIDGSPVDPQQYIVF